MIENNKFIIWFLIGIFVLCIHFVRQIEKKIDLVWEDITIVGDTLKAELDKINEKLDALESEVQNIHK